MCKKLGTSVLFFLFLAERQSTRDSHDESIVDGFRRIWDDGHPRVVLHSRNFGCPEYAGHVDEQRCVCDVPPDADSVVKINYYGMERGYFGSCLGPKPCRKDGFSKEARRIGESMALLTYVTCPA